MYDCGRLTSSDFALQELRDRCRTPPILALKSPSLMYNPIQQNNDRSNRCTRYNSKAYTRKQLLTLLPIRDSTMICAFGSWPLRMLYSPASHKVRTTAAISQSIKAMKKRNIQMTYAELLHPASTGACNRTHRRCLRLRSMGMLSQELP